MEEQIELRELLYILRKRIGMISIITVIAVIISALVSYFILKPQYETSTTLIVNKAYEEDRINHNDIMLNQRLVSTYGEIVKSRAVLEKTIKDLKLENTYEQLQGNIKVTPVKDTQIMRITVSGNDPALITKIANTTAKNFIDEVTRIMNIENVQIIDTAKLPKNPIKPKRSLNIAIAFVLGIMLGVFIAFLIEYLDNTIKTPKDIENHLDLPVIGVIPLNKELKM
ncbi:Capsular polysaccharide biosynthesis protein [Alkalithermobacter thermoalcaliphilus JW-YL-7 = DSM 7308]|uniref:Capsular polysaccharide biosynthesis protein n=1 Tax=Alkalithermobacter thermoalcaliphilus JW-YL-7 = DSM 7308 TaxID=1121328 RepID=A0A150FSK7_CLOPD|nr:lipopolysaccharide biosynthesis protein [[Clostridium] paradoxum JW-YL-7 = DSM 7308]SHK69821.1 Capsular polysaccharide biosynthesis protein [[Clostridium] paradoxum JW-YL-7 = DSM 7308]